MPRIDDFVEISSRLVMIRIGNHRLMGTGFILGHSMKPEGQQLHTVDTTHAIELHTLHQPKCVI